MSIESVLANKSLIKGFLTPLFYEEHTDRAALGPDDFRKCVEGYACPRCLAEFPVCLVKCPLCELVFDSARDFEDPPDEWVDNLKEHERIQRHAESERFNAKGQLVDERGRPLPAEPVPSFDSWMERVKRDKEIEQVPLSKLKKRKRH